MTYLPSVTKSYVDAVRQFPFVIQPVSTSATSDNPLIIGTVYENFGAAITAGTITSVVLKVHFETDTSGQAANIDVFDFNGVTNGGVSIEITGSHLTNTSTTGSIMSVDLTSALTSTSGAGLFKVRLWTALSRAAATCSYCALIIT